MFLAFQALEKTPAETLITTQAANSRAPVEDRRDAEARDRLVLLNDEKTGVAVVAKAPPAR